MRAVGASERYTYAGGAAAAAGPDAAEPPAAPAALFAFDLCDADERLEAVFWCLLELEPPLAMP